MDITAVLIGIIDNYRNNLKDSSQKIVNSC